jgi:branched-chain amino acid transport system substrate-binding protein
MRSERMKMVVGLILVIIMAITASMFGCKAQEGATTPATTQPTTEVKTLKIGVIMWLGIGLGTDSKKSYEMEQELINNSGGLTIGNEKYKVEFIIYDNNMSDSAQRSAVNRLIFEDKVKFIISDNFAGDGWIPTADENRVLALGASPSDYMLSPDFHYVFRAYPTNAPAVIMIDWMARTHPEKNKWVFATMDTEGCHISADIAQKYLKTYNVDCDVEYYPPNASDLSSLGTKVKTLNPDVLLAVGGGPEKDSLVYKAAYQAGYHGQFFNTGQSSVMALAQVIPAEMLEGMIKGEDPCHLDPIPRDIGAEFKNNWVAKYGKWEEPSIIWILQWYGLKTALQQAGSTDVDKVTDVFANGLQFESPQASCQMVARPDLGNNRTVDCVWDSWITQAVNGEANVLAHISLADGVAVYSKYYQK